MNRKYILKKVKFKMEAAKFDDALKCFKFYFSDIEEFDMARINHIKDAFAAFDFETVQDDDGNIVSLKTINGEMPDWFYLFVKSIERQVVEPSEIKFYYEDDGIMREYTFYHKCFEYFNVDESIPVEHTTTEEERKNKTNYMLLDRCRSDCKYFLGYGNRNEKTLWGGNVPNHISSMRKLYCLLPVKPNWITMRKIKEYEKLMSGILVLDKETEERYYGR